tara:strand:+ start:672 stop:1661 length:990 start_codon:yes stop_codon:yes gene_type:complete
MIIKSFEINKIDHKKNKNYLFYGENYGLITEILEKKFKSEFKNKIYNYEESEILKNEKDFFDKILTHSFFDNEKLLIISRSTDKIFKIAEEIITKNIDDLSIIFLAGNLDKKSKLRKLFEKDKKSVCIAFYPDSQKTLSQLVNNFFKNIKVPVSQEIINTIVEKSDGDRQELNNELVKIENFVKNKKSIRLEEILKLTNSSTNNRISELVDFCLAKNERKIVKILNENNFSKEDTILIIKIFMNKVKRLIKLKNQIQENKNIDNVISNFKPVIFWKDKDLVKQQLINWSNKDIGDLLNSTNENELLIKKNYENSLKILFNFIFSTVKAS